MSGLQLHRLGSALDRVTASGSDPEALAAVLGWCVLPRRGPATLRRQVVEPDGRIDRRRLFDVVAPHLTPEVAEVVGRIATTWEQLRCRAALLGDPAYPVALADAAETVAAPLFLVGQGTWPMRTGPSVAIVGARRAGSYGAGIAAWLASTLAERGIRIISGGAVGIDAAAHVAALGAAGGTAVVLGSGHAIRYPRPHHGAGGLFSRVIADGGTIMSEHLPDVPPRAGIIRGRNRIVAAVADAVVVVEGGQRSGSLLTASTAADIGRPVLAVPGDVRAPGSQAPHQLLREGASPCTGPQDVIDVLPQVGAVVASDIDRASDTAADAPGVPAAVLTRLASAWPRSVAVEQLAREVDLPVAAVLAAVTRGQIAGALAIRPDGVVLRRRPADPDHPA